MILSGRTSFLPARSSEPTQSSFCLKAVAPADLEGVDLGSLGSPTSCLVPSDDHGLDVLVFLDHLSHCSHIGGPQSWKVGLLMIPSEPGAVPTTPARTSSISGMVPTSHGWLFWKLRGYAILLGLPLSQTLCHFEWTQCYWSQMGPFGLTGLILFLWAEHVLLLLNSRGSKLGVFYSSRFTYLHQ